LISQKLQAFTDDKQLPRFVPHTHLAQRRA
jgi:hypothetical protein